jgi:hypothetical protein
MDRQRSKATALAPIPPALPPKADVRQTLRHGRDGPISGIAALAHGRPSDRRLGLAQITLGFREQHRGCSR